MRGCMQQHLGRVQINDIIVPGGFGEAPAYEGLPQPKYCDDNGDHEGGSAADYHPEVAMLSGLDLSRADHGRDYSQVAEHVTKVATANRPPIRGTGIIPRARVPNEGGPGACPAW